MFPSLAASPFFFFNDTATTEIYTLSLHDALPILALTLWNNLAPSSRWPGALGLASGHNSRLESQAHDFRRTPLKSRQKGTFYPENDMNRIYPFFTFPNTLKYNNEVEPRCIPTQFS